MTRKRIKILIGIIFIGIVFWQLGLFHRFNYLTAKIDIMQKNPRIVQVGMPLHGGVAYKNLNQDYGFYESIVGCFIIKPQFRGIEQYNAEVEKYLTKKNGENWREEYQAKLDSLVINGLINN